MIEDNNVKLTEQAETEKENAAFPDSGPDQNDRAGNSSGSAFTVQKRPKVKGGHLRDMINYSDRF